jgi:hypothetical protein
MLLGLSAGAFTLVHVVISLVAIGSGVMVMVGMLSTRQVEDWTLLFLSTSVLTSVTGFLFPHDRLLPSHVVGIVSLCALALAIFALYGRGLAGAWRRVYAISATSALYLNVFVAVVQAFQKLPTLHRLAPTRSEPPFVAAQLAVLAVFATLGFLAVRRRQPTAKAAT